MLANPKIILPQDPNMKGKLERKLEEYRERLVKYSTDLFIATDSEYKIAVVEKLLDTGEVDTWRLSRELWKQYGKVDVAAFESVCTVIDDYCKTGGKHVRGGTGL